MDFSLLAKKRILVTGHTGFKGTWLCHLLTKFGAEVHGISLPNQRFDFYETSMPLEAMNSHLANLIDPILVEKCVNLIEPDLTFHLAAQPLVRLSYLEPRLTFEANVMGTVNLLESLRNSKTNKATVVITTDKVYKNTESKVGYNEDSPLGGHDPYSASKSAVEHVVSAYRAVANYEGSKTPIVSARSGNVIGGGDHAIDRLMPDLMKGFKRHEEVAIRNPNSIRPWQHVLDPIVGYVKIAISAYQHELPNFQYNFGPSEKSRLNVLEMATFATEIWASDATIKIDNPKGTSPKETEILWLDSSRATKELGWNCHLDARDAIRWTVEWEKRTENECSKSVTFDQIDRYVETFL